MEKTYNPSEFETSIYNNWLGKKYFSAKIDKSKKPFTIIMPPPNITSKLHMGHAFQQTIQDIIIRRKRMQGYSALWVPGTDHAALATEYMLCKQLENEGTSKEELGRAEFKKRIDQWYKDYKGTIIEQFKRMGYSCDWDRLSFTMDEGNCNAVRKVFVHLYKKGWIYKGKRIVNWCPKCRSSISDAEVEFKDVPSHLWHIRYQIEGTDKYIEVATTRPETILGDTAVAVNPNDDRYKDVVGKNVVLPLVNKLIPIVADEYVEMDFGTGVVKITPAHDPNDFEVGLRHNLEVVKVIGDDGVMNELAEDYAGLTREEARERIVADLKTAGNLVKIEDYSHNVGHCERCKTVIEPLISSQWFVKMEELAKPAIEVVENGKVRFMDEQYKKTYLNWMKNIKDWCISRQIWSGHDIPIFTCDDCGEVIVEETDPAECPKCHSHNLSQELDKLDTWFSSALWPISTLGYPNDTEELKYFYPTNVMVTAREIINLWVARMIFSGLEYVGEIPFRDIVINGIVKDANGKKMSKTLGNGTDPIEMIDKYGVDALRFSVFDGVAIQSDSRFSEKKVELTRNFINKIWNASRYVLMQVENVEIKDIQSVNLTYADKWILSELNKTIDSVNNKFEKYDIGMAASELKDFFWDKFCDWYIELSKCDIAENKEGTCATLVYVLTQILKMLHPFIPFVTEKIYLELPVHDESIMISAWPEKLDINFDGEVVESVREVIGAIRNIRAEKKVPDNKKINAQVLVKKDCLLDCLKYISKLALINEIPVVDNEESFESNSVKLTFNDIIINLPLDSMVDSGAEKERIEKEIARLKSEIERSERLLSNAGFVAKAPESLINAEKEKLEKHKALLAELTK
ncbi:MAG: valine--tRNA ligase [Clostridia bacterium]|nr:valine--tRNA ligase [Clostridia bacterium]